MASVAFFYSGRQARLIMYPKILNIYLLTCVLFFSLSGCGDSDSEVISFGKTSTIQLADSLEIQETDDRFIGELVDADVAIDPLRIYVADRKMQRVAVINSNGSIEQFIGGPGKGPGELGRPVFLSVDGARLVVAQQRWRGFTVFDTSGAYIDNHRLPDGYWVGGYDLFHFGDGYILPITKFNPQKEGTLKLPSDQETVAKLDSKFDVKEMIFGSYPDLYQEGEYISQRRTMDISVDSLAAVGYQLVPTVRLYNLNKEEYPMVQKVSLGHPEFHRPKEETPLGIAMDDQSELYERMSSYSLVKGTFLLRDSIVVQHFANHSKGYHARTEFNPSEQEYYATLGVIGSTERLHLTLPGRLLAVDEKDRLYVELNPTPDERKIGIYEVNWP